MKSKFFFSALSLAAATLTMLPGANAATVIFSDDFSTGTDATLNGQAPQVRPGTETWRAATVYTKDTAGDGVVTSTGTGSANLALPAFDLNSIYTVTARVSNTTTGTSWIGIGFTTQTTNTNAWNVAGTGTYWMLWRGNDGFSAFNGTGATNGVTGISGNTSSAGLDNTIDLRVMLDFTTSGFGTVTYMFKNPDASDWTTFGTSAISEGLRNGINSVGFTTNTTSTSIQSFEYAIIPEPSTALLGGLGILCLLRRRR